MKNYSFVQVCEAKTILENWEWMTFASTSKLTKEEQAKELQRQINWARRVIYWFEGYLKIVRYHYKRCKWCEAVKMAWQAIRKHIDKQTMDNIFAAIMRDEKRQPREFRLDTGEYCRDRYPQKQAQKSRAYKSRMRMNYMNKANKLQTIW